MPVQGDAKLSDDDKTRQAAEINAKIAKIDEMAKKAETDTVQARITAFIAADKDGNCRS